MGGNTLSTTSEVLDRTTDTDPSHGPVETPDSPGIRLLDALRAGDDAAVLALCSSTTTISADTMTWSCRGRAQVQRMLIEARDRFPGITYESRTRQVGFGIVVEEARVRDVPPEVPADEVAVDADGEPVTAPDHPMYDDPVFAAQLAATTRTTTRELTLWRDQGGDEPPAPLSMPVRVTVHHDDMQVHQIELSFPAALLRRALGERVDPFELSLSEVQSAFVAPVGAGLTSTTLDRVDPPAEPAPPVDTTGGRSPRRWRRWLLALTVLALVGAGAWWAVQAAGGRETASAATVAPSVQPSASASVEPSASPSAESAAFVPHAPRSDKASDKASDKPADKVSGKPADAPSRAPSVTLGSELAFGVNSATLSPRAMDAIDRVARQVISSGLRGRIHVDGYTDSTGPAAYDVELSQRRADAVSSYLRTRLIGAPVSIVSTGHGEAHPVADNATAAGRQANRRVTITLPRP